MSSSDNKDTLEISWALLSVILGEAFAKMAVWPNMVDVPLVSRAFLSWGFGLMLGAMFFLIGMPLVSGLKLLNVKISGRVRGARSERPKES